MMCLTCTRPLMQTVFPKTVQGVADAFAVSHTVRRAVLFFCQQHATGVSCGIATYRRKRRPGVRETPAALHWPGSVVSAFFCALRNQNPNKVQVLMSNFTHTLPVVSISYQTMEVRP